MFAVVADTGLWVDANPKESDMTYVRAGLPATVTIDAFPGREWKGTICSIAPGTGAQFAILPPQNASGNWVKVVQRVPLRFCFDPNEDTTRPARRHERLSSRSTPAARARLRGALEGLGQWVRRLRRHPRRGADRRHPMNAQATAPPLYETIAPTLKWLLTVCIMMATIMQALDTTIANVALPYMQGSLSTTQDQINWVLTSYIVAAAIMTSPLGWMATRFGRKKLFIVCTAGFTVASMLCGVALSIEQMVAYRLLQGVFGAALVPLSQAVMLDIFPPAKRGSAMAIWGMGVMLGPIMGPTLGGWLTDSYSWRWVFFVNLPFGILTTARPLDLHERDADPARRAVLLVRLPEPVARHRRAADDARPRRAARLVRIDRDHRRGDPRRRRLLFLPRRLPDRRSARSSACASSATGTSRSRSSSCS